MAAGSPLSDDQKAMMFGPAFAEIQARNEASRMAALASILAPGEFPQSPVVSNWAMGQLQGMMPGGGAMPSRPLDPVEASKLAVEAENARDYQQRLILSGVDEKTANADARRRFPSRISPWKQMLSDAWGAAPGVGWGMRGLADFNAQQDVAEISPKVLQGLQEKARAGDEEAQRILSEGGYSW